ncbi:MAG: NHL repeat-containing protein [Thermoleophilia bacterium]
MLSETCLALPIRVISRQRTVVNPTGGRGVRRLYLALILLLAAALAVLVFAYSRVLDRDAETPLNTVATEIPSGLAGEPTFLYEITAPVDRPFRPRNAAVSGALVYVADSEGQRVAALDLAAGPGAELAFIPITPDSLEQTLPRDPQPTAVGVLADGSLLVADPANGRIWRVTPDGTFLGEFPAAEERQRSELISPVGLTVAGGEVFVTDVGDQRVKVYSVSGTFLRLFGGEGFRPGLFSFPNGVVVDRDGLVYVADSNNKRVQIIGAGDSVVTVIQRTDTEEGLVLPRGVAFDRFGRLHVVDTFSQAVFVYGSDGEFAFVYGRGPGTQARLTLPEGIAITENRVVVSDGGGRRMVVYSY